MDLPTNVDTDIEYDCVTSCASQVSSLSNCFSSLPSSSSTSSESEAGTEGSGTRSVLEGGKCLKELLEWKGCCEEVKTKAREMKEIKE